MTTATARKSASLLLAIVCSFLSLTTSAQVTMTRTPDPPPILSDHAKGQLQEKLSFASATPLQAVDVDGAPIEITKPQATSVKIEGNYDAPPDALAMMNDYVAKLSIRILNRSNQRVTGIGLAFTNTQQNNTFYLYPGPIDI